MIRSRSSFVLGTLLTSLLGIIPLAVTFQPQALAAIDKKPVVFVREAATAELADQLTYPARVEPRIRASIVAESDGIVSKISAPLGSEVRARQALLVLRNTDPVYQYSPMIVSSPVSGVVSKVEVTEGSRVSRGDKLALVTDPQQVRVVVEVTAQDLPMIRPGLEANLQIPGQANSEPLKLKVKGISPFVDPATGTAQCELEVAKPVKAAKGKESTASASLPPPGIIARVSFRANVRKGISLPETVLTYRGAQPFVRAVQNGKAKYVPVEIGRKQGGYVEIVKGVKDGDRVVERTSAFVADGEAVEVKAQEGSERKPAAADAAQG